MIEVRGTHTETAQTAEDADEGPKKSLTPYAALGLLISAVLYLKAFFTQPAQAVEVEEPAPDSGSGLRLAAEKTLTPEPAPEAAPPEEPAPFSEPLFAAGSSDTIDLFDAERMSLPVMRPAAFVAHAANDRYAPQPAAVSSPGMASPHPFSVIAQEPAASGSDSRGQDEGEEEDDPRATPNRAPTVLRAVNLGETSGCALLTIAASDLLGAATDADGDALAVTGLVASSGKLVQSGQGWVFDPEDMLGNVTFSYQVTDGQVSVPQQATLAVVKDKPIIGTTGDDVLLGTECPDVIDALDGDDLISSDAENDVIDAGDGDDHIISGAGNDVVRAGAGNDIVLGGRGDDHISGGAGNDRLSGEEGNDVLIGDAGDDGLSGGSGHDVLWGSAGDDELEGGAGHDTLLGGAGEDRMAGGTGNDRMIASHDGAADWLEGGLGSDTLDYSAATTALDIDLVKGRVNSVEVGQDTITGFESVIAGGGNDRFILGPSSMTLRGGAGRDEYVIADAGDPPENAAFGGNPDAAPRQFRIEDFAVGDQLHISRYRFFDQSLDDERDEDDAGTDDELFAHVFGDDEDDIPIRLWDDLGAALKQTVIEADMDRDGEYELSVHLDGRHSILVYETA